MTVDYASMTYAVPRLDLGEALFEARLRQEDFIASQVMPIFKTPKKAATYSAITRESMLAVSDSTHAPRSAVNRVNIGAKDKTFNCQEYMLEAVVDPSEMALYASDFNMELAQTRKVDYDMRINREVRVAAKLFNTTTWTGSALYTDVSGSAPWTTAASDPVKAVTDACEKVRINCGMMPNALILNKTNLNRLVNNTSIRGRFPYDVMLTVNLLAANFASIFGLEKLIVGQTVLNSAIEGQAFVGGNVWSNLYAMVAIIGSDSDDLSMPQVGRSFLWTGVSEDEGFIESYPEPQTNNATIIREKNAIDEVVIDPYFAHLVKVAAS